MLILVDVPVLHAASCEVDGSYVAFSGKSGAGKTTTARAFERRGALLISEDLLVISSEGDRPGLYVEGEAFARSWARIAATDLEANPARMISYSALAEARRGRVVPLDALWFLSADRRRGSDFGVRRLSTSDGLLTLLGTGLLATSDPLQWSGFLWRSHVIAEKVALWEVTAPAGLHALVAAAGRYRMNSAS